MASQINRARVRVGRHVTYFPTDAEATAGGGNAGDRWPAVIADVNSTGTADMTVFRANGTTLAKTAVSRGQIKGTFDVLAGAAAV